MSTERETTADDFKQSIFAGIQSLQEGLGEFYPEVEEIDHVCDDPDECAVESMVYPICSWLALTAKAEILAKSSTEEFELRKTWSEGKWFEVAIEALELWTYSK